MGWLVLSFIICIITGVMNYFAEYEQIEDFFVGFFFGVVISLCVIAISGVIALGYTEIIKTEEEIQYNIIGLENKDSIKTNIHGSFILGCGGISRWFIIYN